MLEENFEKYKKAGKALGEVRKEALSKIIKPGAKILDIANFIENKIVEKGCGPAFPVNISIDDVVAHYTPTAVDTREIKEGELVKIDIGVQVDGFIADSAITYCSEKNEIVESSRNLMKRIMETVKPGLPVFEIGNLVEEESKRAGVGIIVNLTGHMLDQNVFHGIPSIPNIRNKTDYQFKEGDAFAIEPFLTDSNGYVKESGGPVEIYRYLQDKPIRLPEGRKVLDHIKTNFGAFPFAKRWLYDVVSPGKVAMVLRQLEMSGALETYPILKEVENKKVAQIEHTFVIHKGKVVVTTLAD